MHIQIAMLRNALRADPFQAGLGQGWKYGTIMLCFFNRGLYSIEADCMQCFDIEPMVMQRGVNLLLWLAI